MVPHVFVLQRSEPFFRIAEPFLTGCPGVSIIFKTSIKGYIRGQGFYTAWLPDANTSAMRSAEEYLTIATLKHLSELLLITLRG